MTNRSTANIDLDERHRLDERVIGLDEYRVVALVDTCHGTCCGGQPDDSDTMTLVDIRVLFALMTGYASSDSSGKSLKLVFALYASIPVVVLNHQYIGFLLLPRGPVMTASIP